MITFTPEKWYYPLHLKMITSEHSKMITFTLFKMITSPILENDIICCYHLFYVIIWCYHFSQFANVIIFPYTAWVLSFMFSFNVIIFCYHFLPFSFSWKRDTLHSLSYADVKNIFCINQRYPWIVFTIFLSNWLYFRAKNDVKPKIIYWYRSYLDKPYLYTDTVYRMHSV